MQIEYFEGCTYSLKIDGIEYMDLSYEKQKEVARILIDYANEGDIQQFIEYVTQSRGEYKDLGYCEQCGSYNDLYNLNIKEDVQS